MALFDQFGPAQSPNGFVQPNPQTLGGAGYGYQPGMGAFGGYQPPGLAGGLAQFLASRGIAAPNPGATGTGVASQFQQPNAQPTFGYPGPSLFGAGDNAQQPNMLKLGPAAPLSAPNPMQPTGPVGLPMGSAGFGASQGAPQGMAMPPNLAGGLRPYLPGGGGM